MDRIVGADTIELSPGKRGFRSKDTIAGMPGTVLTAKWCNDVQEEIATAIEKSGLALDTATRDQLARATRSQRLNYVAAPGGTGDALTLDMDPAPANYASLAGAPLRVKIVAPNTGAVTARVNALAAVPVVDRAGAALGAGELIAGEIVTLKYDGARFRLDRRTDKGNQLLSGSGWCQLAGGLIMQWGSFGGTTLNSSGTGVYEAPPITVPWPIAFPAALLQVVGGTGTDVSGAGLQEQAWFTDTTRTYGLALVACRQVSSFVGGSFIAFGY